MVVASQQQIYPQIIQRSYYTPVVRQDHVRVTMNFNIIAALSCVKFPTNMYETSLVAVFVILNVLICSRVGLGRHTVERVVSHCGSAHATGNPNCKPMRNNLEQSSNIFGASMV